MPRGAALDSAGHDARVTLLDDGAYLLHIECDHARDGGAGALLFFGALHSKDPAHPQLAELRRAWKEFGPTAALVEGRMSFFVGGATQGIGVFGEGAAVYSLAERSGIPLYTLEPPLEVEIAALDEIGDRTQVAMFRVLSGYISARRGRGGRGGEGVSDFKINRLLRQRAAPLTDALPSIAAFDAYFAAQFPELHGWRDLPEEAMWPGKTDTLLHRWPRARTLCATSTSSAPCSIWCGTASASWPSPGAATPSCSNRCCGSRCSRRFGRALVATPVGKRR